MDQATYDRLKGQVQQFAHTDNSVARDVRELLETFEQFYALADNCAGEGYGNAAAVASEAIYDDDGNRKLKVRP